MNYTLPGGQNIEFPDGTRPEVAQAYIDKYYPPEPNVLGRAVGHLAKGAARVAEMGSNLSSYFNPSGETNIGPIQKFFEESAPAQMVTAHPETSMLGQALGGIVEFLPQLPVYQAGGAAVLGPASMIPKIGKYAEALVTASPEASAMANYGKAIARAAVEGGVVGTAVGTPASTPIGEKITEGGKEALGFAGATAVLHQVFAGLGIVGRGLFRKFRGDAAKVKTELEARAENDPAAAEDLATLNENLAKQTEEAEQPYVPTGTEEVKVEPTKATQAELPLEPLPDATLAKFADLGYSEADLAGRTDKELIDILEKGTKNATTEGTQQANGVEQHIGASEIRPPAEASGSDSTVGSRLEQQPEGEAAPQPWEMTLEDYLAYRLGKNYTMRKEEYAALGGQSTIDNLTKYWQASVDQATMEGKATETAFKQKADELGITFNGLQERLNKPSIPLFTDPETKTTFTLKDGETVEAALERKRAEFEQPSVEKINKATKLIPDEIRELLRMGYQGSEIKAMKPDQARATIEAAKNVPEPTAEEVAKATEAAQKVEEAVRAKEAIPVEERVPLTEAQKAQIDAEVEKDIADAENEPLSEVGDLIVKISAKMAGVDPTLDTLLEGLPKTPEEVQLNRKVIIEGLRENLAQRQMAKAAATIPPEARGKARRARKQIDYAKEAEEWEAKLREEGMPDELSFDESTDKGTTFYSDPFGIQTAIDYTKKLLRERKTIASAPHNKIIADVNGKQLTIKDDADFVDGTMKQMATNVGNLARNKAMSPDFAFRNNEKVEPLIFNIHKRFFEGNFEASKHNEVIRSAESLLYDTASKEHIKDILEGKTKEVTPAELEAAGLIRGELDAVRDKYKWHLRDEFKKNLNEDEFAALSEIIAGKPIDEVVAKYRERIVPDKLGRRRTRKWLDEEVVRDIASEYSAIDKWGLDDYVTHYERGPLRIVSGGKLYAKAMSEKDAARKFADLQAMYPDKEFQLDTQHNMGELATGLSKRSYNRLLFSLQEGLKQNIENINNAAAYRLAQKGLKGRFFIKPTQQFSPYTMDRKEFLQGEKNVFDILYNYMYSMEKKMALDPAIDDVRRAITKQEVVGTEEYKAKDGSMKMREIKRPYLKEDEIKYLERYIEDVKGKLYRGDELVDAIFKNTGSQRMYSRAIQSSRELQANLKLGYAPIKGLINGLSGLGHIWTKTGVRYITEGTKFLQTTEGKEFIKAMEPYLGVNIVESATGELSVKGSLEKGLEKTGILTSPEGSKRRKVIRAAEPLAVFQAPELPVRKLTIAANYLMAKESGLGEAAARDAAIKANWFQQFTYDIASLPELMRSPTGKLLMQFKPYLLKELEFISTLRGPEIARYIGMQVALGGPRGLIMIAKSLPLIGAFYGWNELEDWMNKEYPRISRGLVGGVTGTDISAAATFQFPATMRDWLGPTLADLGAFKKDVVDPMMSGETVEGGKFAVTSFPILRHWGRMWEQVVDKDGWVKDERGRRLWHIDDMAGFVAKSVAGAEPIELNRLRVAEFNLTQKNIRLTEQKVSTIDDVLDAVAKGKLIEKDTIDNMTRLGISPSTLRRAAKFRVLDPKQRRLLMTEVIRRPEILEQYPEASDLQQ